MRRRDLLKLPFAALAVRVAGMQSGSLRKVTINYPNRSGSNWPLFLAKEGGYYQKYGLDAELVFGVHPAGIAMLVSGQGQMVNSSLEQLNLAEHEDIFAATAYIMKKSTVASDPALAERLIKAHAEGIKRFYEDKPFAVQAFLKYDRNAQQSDMERVYELYAKSNAFERVPYVLAPAVQSVIQQQPDPGIAAQLKSYDFHKVIDNSHVAKLVKENFFEQLFGPSIKAEEQRKAKLAFGI